MHLNSVQVIGRVGKNGPKLSYASSGAPSTIFTLEVDELSKSGEVFTLYLPIELWGQAELAAETLEAGDEVMLTGRLKYKSHVDAKTQVKVSKLIISSWGVSQRIPALTVSAQDERTDPGEGDSTSTGEIVAPGGDEREPATKARRPRKTTKRPWVPSGLVSSEN